MKTQTFFHSAATHRHPKGPGVRILHVVFSSHFAGSERYCADLANRQAELGYEVSVAGMRSSLIAKALSPDVDFHGFSVFFRGLMLRRLISRLNPDICHAHLSGACKTLGRMPSRPLSVATLHVGYKPHQHDRLDGLICVNRTQAGRLSRYPGMARIIPNWMPAMRPGSASAGIRRELGIGEDEFLVGAVGRLHKSKGMDLLISAFRATARVRSALVIVGEGPERARLEALCDGDARIHFLGHRADISGCLDDLDLFVSPSREESFGLAILEAMGAGVPIISTATEGPVDYLHSQPVQLVPTGSVEQLAQAMASEQSRHQHRRRRRIAYDLSLFNPQERVAGITDFYNDVIAAKGWSRAGLVEQVALSA